jgi:hypothetical protein
VGLPPVGDEERAVRLLQDLDEDLLLRLRVRACVRVRAKVRARVRDLDEDLLAVDGEEDRVRAARRDGEAVLDVLVRVGVGVGERP